MPSQQRALFSAAIVIAVMGAVNGWYSDGAGLAAVQGIGALAGGLAVWAVARRKHR